MVFHVAHGVWQKAVLLTFLSGIVEILMGVLQLGFIIDFVSGPVSAGFTSAVALIIFTSQIKNILVVNSTGSSFLESWITMIGDMHNMRVADAILGLSCVTILIALRFLGSMQIGPKADGEKKYWHKMINKFLWFLGVAGNAVLVFICTGCVTYLESQGKSYFRLTGYIPSGFPEVQLPQFSYPTVAGNSSTAIAGETFFDVVRNFGSCSIVIPLISMLETMAVCKTFGKWEQALYYEKLVCLKLTKRNTVTKVVLQTF